MPGVPSADLRPTPQRSPAEYLKLLSSDLRPKQPIDDEGDPDDEGDAGGGGEVPLKSLASPQQSLSTPADLRPKQKVTVFKARRTSGKVCDFHLDQATIDALKSCQKTLSKPKGVTYCNATIVRRALQYYHAMIVSINKSRKPDKMDLLADEGSEVRLAGAGSPLRNPKLNLKPKESEL